MYLKGEMFGIRLSFVTVLGVVSFSALRLH